MSRILVPGGKTLLNVPFLYWLHEQPHDYYRYTEFALRRFARLSGFEVLVLQPVGGAPEVLTDILAKHAARLGWGGARLAAAISTACQAFIHTSIGNRISSKTGAVFPIAYFMVAQKLVDGLDSQ